MHCNLGKLQTKWCMNRPALGMPISSPILGGVVKIMVPGLIDMEIRRSRMWEYSWLTSCFPSAFRMTSVGTPLNCWRGVMEPHLNYLGHAATGENLETHIRFSSILHKSSAAFASTAHLRFKQILNMAWRILRKCEYQGLYRSSTRLTIQRIASLSCEI